MNISINSDSEVQWRTEAMREFPGHVWTGREAEWVASFVETKRKEALEKRKEEQSDAFRKSRPFFGRGRGNYRAAIYAEVLMCLWIPNPLWYFLGQEFQKDFFGALIMLVWMVATLLFVLHVAHHNAGLMEAGLEP
jgi:hypothetical protein